MATTITRIPKESEFDLIADRLLIMGKHPEYKEDGETTSYCVITKNEVLWAMHYMKNHDEWNSLISFGFGFSGEKDGSYTVRTYPEWLIGEYIWDSQTGMLYFKRDNERPVIISEGEYNV